jgi:hypothetical protein
MVAPDVDLTVAHCHARKWIDPWRIVPNNARSISHSLLSLSLVDDETGKRYVLVGDSSGDNSSVQFRDVASPVA